MLGSLIAQGCHASVFAICMFKDLHETAEYLSDKNICRMSKCVLEVENLEQFEKLEKT